MKRRPSHRKHNADWPRLSRWRRVSNVPSWFTPEMLFIYRRIQAGHERIMPRRQGPA